MTELEKSSNPTSTENKPMATLFGRQWEMRFDEPELTSDAGKSDSMSERTGRDSERCENRVYWQKHEFWNVWKARRPMGYRIKENKYIRISFLYCKNRSSCPLWEALLHVPCVSHFREPIFLPSMFLPNSDGSAEFEEHPSR